MFWNKTITLYNRAEDNQTGAVKWYRHRIEYCFCKQTNSQMNTGVEQFTHVETIVRIPEQDNYQPAHKWVDLSDNEKAKHITLQSGDLIVLGDITDTIDECTNGKRSNDLIKKYTDSGAISVKSVNINNSLPGAHYFVKGR